MRFGMIRAALANQPAPAVDRAPRPQGEESALEQASRRLQMAIDGLEAAVNHRLDDHSEREGLEAQIQAYGSDRSKLADELDRLRSRSANLEAANREVSRRLGQAVETIRAALEPRER
jgi:chromosome segregation ATPase